MAKEIFNRYENKYLLNKEQYNELQKLISSRMVRDTFNVDDKMYLISNIYYDTEDNHLIRTSLEKPIYKEKIRIRSYGPITDDEFVYLEIKKKFNGIVNKRRTKLTLREAKLLLEYNKIELKDYMNKQVIRELQSFLYKYKVLPKVYLSYERLAYFSKDDDDLRLTIDKNIRADRNNVSLNNINIGDELLEDDKFLMEIKTSKALPIWLVEALSKNKIYPTSFSKYGAEYKKHLKSNNKLSYIIDYKTINDNSNDNIGGKLYGYIY